MKKTNYILLLTALAVVFASCSPKTKKVTIDNSKSLNIDGGLGIRPVPNGQPGQNETYGIKYNLMWDIELTVNGVDFGTIKGGESSETKDVPDANNLKVEKFNILKNEEGLSVYYIDNNLGTGEKVYVDFNADRYKKVKDMQKCEMNMTVMEAKFKKTDQAGGLLNDSWKWDISYGENGNALANKAKEEAKKKKKK